MTASRRPPRTSLPSLLAIGVACAGGACSAPTQPVPETPGYEAPEAPSPATSPIDATTTPTDTTPAPPSEPAPASDPPSAAEPPPTATPAPAKPKPVPIEPPAPPPTTGAMPDPPKPPAQADDEAQPATLTVTMLSRGKGVPDEARAAYKDIRALLEQQRATYAVTDLRTQRIGLEGETRLCAEFRSAKDAQAALDEIRKRADGVDLLEISEVSCPSPKEAKP